MLDDFREWLSDNLRYFMLGGAILLVLLVVIFGFRACAGCGKDKKEEKNPQKVEQQEKEPSGDEVEGEEETKIENPLVEAEAEVKELITNYYKALGEKDIETLKTLLTELSPSDEAKITNATYIEGYEMGDVYTKKGLDDKSYVVYACYSYLCSNIETPVPAMSQVYVVEDEDGKLLIVGAEKHSSDVARHMDALLGDSDVTKLVAEVQKAYDDAQAADPALADFLAGLGNADSDNAASNAEEGAILTVTEGCNVRAEASSDGDIIGGYDEGAQVEKLGVDGDWIKIEYEGQTGYIHNSLLE